MPPIQLHDCIADGCSIRIPNTRLFCTRHWLQLTKDEKQRLAGYFTPGLHVHDQPALFQILTVRIVCRLAVVEGRLTQHEASVRVAHARKIIEGI